MTEDKKKDFSFDDKEEKTSVSDEVDRFLDIKKLDENNPQEKARKYREVKNNPPSPGYMKVEGFEVEDDEGNKYLETKGGGKTIKHEPIFTLDLKTLIDADIAASPSNIVPMLIDNATSLAVNEKKEFKPEKRRDEFNWWWIVFFLLMIPGIVLVILMFI